MTGSSRLHFEPMTACPASRAIRTPRPYRIRHTNPERRCLYVDNRCLHNSISVDFLASIAARLAVHGYFHLKRTGQAEASVWGHRQLGTRAASPAFQLARSVRLLHPTPSSSIMTRQSTIFACGTWKKSVPDAAVPTRPPGQRHMGGTRLGEPGSGGEHATASAGGLSSRICGRNTRPSSPPGSSFRLPGPLRQEARSDS
jgi:hypothetical protein